MFYCKDPRQTYKQLDPQLGIEFLIMHYKLFSLEKSALPKCLLMQDGKCQTSVMDMDAAIKVQKEPQGEVGVGSGQKAKDRYPTRQMRAKTSTMEIID